MFCEKNNSSSTKVIITNKKNIMFKNYLEAAHR